MEHSRNHPDTTASARQQPVPALQACMPPAKVPAQGRRDVAVRADPFAKMIPRACLDIVLLYDRRPPQNGLDAFQALLRAMCASGRNVQRAGLQDGQITLDVDGIAVAFGASQLPHLRNDVFYRPDQGRYAHGAARLGFLLYRHQACQRLRVGAAAPAPLLSDVTRLVLHCCPPKAVLILDSRILLSLSEVMARDPATLGGLSPGRIVHRPVARFVRPARVGQARTAKTAVHDRSRSPGALDRLVSDTIAAREEAQLRALLRPRAPVPSSAAPGWRRIAAMGVMFLTAFVWLWGRGNVPF